MRVFGTVTQRGCDALGDGIVIDGTRYGPDEARLDRETAGRNAWLTVAMREGKNREVRNLLEHLDLR